jgi:hypothetical protein
LVVEQDSDWQAVDRLLWVEAGLWAMEIRQGIFWVFQHRLCCRLKGNVRVGAVERLNGGLDGVFLGGEHVLCGVVQEMKQ